MKYCLTTTTIQHPEFIHGLTLSWVFIIECFLIGLLCAVEGFRFEYDWEWEQSQVFRPLTTTHNTCNLRLEGIAAVNSIRN